MLSRNIGRLSLKHPSLLQVQPNRSFSSSTFLSSHVRSRSRLQDRKSSASWLNAPVNSSPQRFLNIHENQSMKLFGEYNVSTPAWRVASKPAEAEAAAKGLTGPDFVVKAQVLTGGRGKGVWADGYEGGVHLCHSALEARSLAAKMLGNTLITKQSGAEGKPCNAVMVTERLYLRRETYFSILMDRQMNGPVLVGSPAGGMDIEAVAADTPELIFKEPIDIIEGITDAQVDRLARAMGFETEETVSECKQVMTNLYQLFIERDCTLVEINPLAETHDGRVLCVDAKLNFDDNAEFRQKELFALRDHSQEDAREVDAGQVGLNYIGLDGSIGCLVNGAGLAMATLDVIKLYGGNPANFLDMGGGANAEQVTSAFRILNDDPTVKAVLVNIFGGIMRCDVIALGLIRAVQTLNIKKPLVVRLAGTNVKEAHQLIEDSGLRMLAATDLGDAAKKAVKVANIVELAEDSGLHVDFELPL